MVLLLLALIVVTPGCSLDTDSTPLRMTIPAEFNAMPMPVIGRVPFVEVSINGEGPYWFLIDTGSFATIIDERVARELDLPSVLRYGRISGSTGMHTGMIPEVDVRSLQLGRVRYEIMDALAMDLSGLARSVRHPVDGVLGYPMFTGAVWTLDYPGRQLIIGERSTGIHAEAVFPITHAATLPTVPAALDDYPLQILIDTGSGFGLELGPEALAQASDIEHSPDVSLAWGISGPGVVRFGRLPDLFRLGPYAIPRPWVGIDVEENVIGGAFLAHFVVTIDRDGQRMALQRMTRGPLPTTPFTPMAPTPAATMILP